MINTHPASCWRRLLPLLILLLAGMAWADEKLVVLDDVPRELYKFSVAADGTHLFFAAPGKYLVFDATGKLVDRYGVPEGSSANKLLPTPEGWFIACNSYGRGHLALYRPDGTLAKRLVEKGGDVKQLRGDMTGWTSPTGAAIDPVKKLIFALDVSVAPSGKPDPIWSRVAIFDYDGNYVGDINRYDGNGAAPVDSRRTAYGDIAVDPQRERVYVTANRTSELLAFDYQGESAGQGAGERGDCRLPGWPNRGAHAERPANLQSRSPRAGGRRETGGPAAVQTGEIAAYRIRHHRPGDGRRGTAVCRHQ